MVHNGRKYGILVIPVTMNASTFAPSVKHTRQILCLLSDKRLRPVYFHCTIGRDRMALIVTLYEIYVLGMPHEKAREGDDTVRLQRKLDTKRLSNCLEKHAKSPCTTATYLQKRSR